MGASGGRGAAVWRGPGPGLTSVAHGSAGWLAVGGEGGPAGTAAQVGAAGTSDSATGPGSQQPIHVTSPDGRAWRPAAGAGPLAGPGFTLAGAAAGRSGYVVAGMRDVHGQPVAALWWSANLTTWVPQGWWTGSARSGIPSALLAVTAGDHRFRRRGRRRRAPGRLALPGRLGLAVAVAGPARRCAQRGTPARGDPGKPHRCPRHAGGAIRAAPAPPPSRSTGAASTLRRPAGSPAYGPVMAWASSPPACWAMAGMRT